MLAEQIARITPMLSDATIDTLLMVVIGLLFAALIGIPLGVLLVVTRPDSILGEHPSMHMVNWLLSTVINIIRAVPFIILILYIMPLTKSITGTVIGVKGAIFPLVLFAAPFIARVTESALLEVKKGIVEAFIALGASPWQIITKVLLRESRSSLVLALTTATVSLIGATAMAGVVGSGGLGDLALRYGYQRYDAWIMNGTIILLIILVQGVQSLGNYTARKLRK